MSEIYVCPQCGPQPEGVTADEHAADHGGQWCPLCRTTDHNEDAHSSVPSGASDVDPLPTACCATCVETLNKVTEIHAAFMGLATSLSAMGENPMIRAMGRQFGVDPAAIAQSMKG